MKKILRCVILFIVTIITVSVTLFALPEKTYVWNCIQPSYDIQKVIIMDADSDGHYETAMTIWCDLDSNKTDTLIHPIIINNPYLIRGKPLNDYAEDPWPWEKTYRPRPSDKPKKPKFTESFYLPNDPTNILYTYELKEGDPIVYYTQYLQEWLSVNDETSDSYIVISPNPASSDIRMNFVMMSENYVKIEIINQNGQLAGVVDNNYYTSGPQDIKINTDKLASGMYIVKTLIGTTTYINKLNVIK